MTFATTRDVSCPGVSLVAAQGWLSPLHGNSCCPGVTFATTREQVLPRGNFRHYPGTVSCPGVTFATTREHKLAQLPARGWLSPLPGNSFLPRGDFRHYMGTQAGPTSCPGATFATTREHKLAQLPRTNRAEGVWGGGFCLDQHLPIEFQYPLQHRYFPSSHFIHSSDWRLRPQNALPCQRCQAIFSRQVNKPPLPTTLPLRPGMRSLSHSNKSTKRSQIASGGV